MDILEKAAPQEDGDRAIKRTELTQERRLEFKVQDLTSFRSCGLVI